jgi:hypothetical protein
MKFSIKVKIRRNSGKNKERHKEGNKEKRAEKETKCFSERSDIHILRTGLSARCLLLIELLTGSHRREKDKLIINI